jgi:NIMA (never in mitosis gene a)-related kinase
MSEDKYLSQEKPMVIGPLKSPTSVKGHADKSDTNNNTSVTSHD